MGRKPFKTTLQQGIVLESLARNPQDRRRTLQNEFRNEQQSGDPQIGPAIKKLGSQGLVHVKRGRPGHQIADASLTRKGWQALRSTSKRKPTTG